MQREVCYASNTASSSALIMNASGKGGECGRMTVISAEARKKPDYKMTAGMLLTACREFFKNPENEEEFQKWMRTGRPNC